MDLFFIVPASGCAAAQDVIHLPHNLAFVQQKAFRRKTGSAWSLRELTTVDCIPVRVLLDPSRPGPWAFTLGNQSDVDVFLPLDDDYGRRRVTFGISASLDRSFHQSTVFVLDDGDDVQGHVLLNDRWASKKGGPTEEWTAIQRQGRYMGDPQVLSIGPYDFEIHLSVRTHLPHIIEAEKLFATVASSRNIDIPSEDWIKHVHVGTGASGSVHLHRGAQSGSIIAVKTIDTTKIVSADSLKLLRHELQVAKRLSHRNISRTFFVDDVALKEHGGAGTSVQLGLSAYHGSLAQLIHEDLAFDRIFHFARDVCAALKYIKAHTVIHRDLKPENVLYRVQWLGETGFVDSITHLRDMPSLRIQFALADFGSSHTLNTTAQTYTGTPMYMAPEIIGRQIHSYPVDMYSFGVVLAEILEKTTVQRLLQEHFSNPFQDENFRSNAQYFRRHLEDVAPQTMLPNLWQYIKRLISEKPLQRPTPTRFYRDIALRPKEMFGDLYDDIEPLQREMSFASDDGAEPPESFQPEGISTAQTKAGTQHTAELVLDSQHKPRRRTRKRKRKRTISPLISPNSLVPGQASATKPQSYLQEPAFRVEKRRSIASQAHSLPLGMSAKDSQLSVNKAVSLAERLCQPGWEATFDLDENREFIQLAAQMFLANYGDKHVAVKFDDDVKVEMPDGTGNGTSRGTAPDTRGVNRH